MENIQSEIIRLSMYIDPPDDSPPGDLYEIGERIQIILQLQYDSIVALENTIDKLGRKLYQVEEDEDIGMELRRLVGVMRQIDNEEIKDVTEEEIEFCLQKGIATRFLLNEQPQIRLTEAGKERLGRWEQYLDEMG